MIKLLILAFKVFKLGKFGGTALTMIASLVIYAWIFGWGYAAGFIGLLFVHEMGHYLAARRRGLAVGAPTFIPFVGAWIELKDTPRDAETEAFVALAGPVVGTLGAFACYLAAREYDSRLLLAVAYSGFFLNLFNLIPLSPLDGGRITGAVSPRLWFLGAPILVAMLFVQPSPLLVMILIMAIPALQAAWRFDPEAPENARYKPVTFETRFELMAFYMLLVVTTALMAGAVHTDLAAHCNGLVCR